MALARSRSPPRAAPAVALARPDAVAALAAGLPAGAAVVVVPLRPAGPAAPAAPRALELVRPEFRPACARVVLAAPAPLGPWPPRAPCFWPAITATLLRP